jgi:DNA-directed RNA polymerase subunit RPC12/RpoP
LRISWGSGEDDRGRRDIPTHEEIRRADNAQIAVGTLACSECDAPVAIGGASLSPADPLTCPYCLHRGPVREFLSLVPPTRPTRVIVRMRTRPSRPARLTASR